MIVGTLLFGLLVVATLTFIWLCCQPRGPLAGLSNAGFFLGFGLFISAVIVGIVLVGLLVFVVLPSWLS